MPFSLRLGWNCAMEDSSPPDPLGISWSSTVIPTKTKKTIFWLFAMQGTARQCVCPGTLSSAGLPATLKQCCFLLMLTHQHLLTHRQLHTMYNMGKKYSKREVTKHWKISSGSTWILKTKGNCKGEKAVVGGEYLESGCIKIFPTKTLFC